MHRLIGCSGPLTNDGYVVNKYSWVLLPQDAQCVTRLSLPSNRSGMTKQKGNIFLCDYKSVEGLPTRVVERKPLPLTAAPCLLYLDTATHCYSAEN
ncbi:unnamed protein product [Lota lota]